MTEFVTIIILQMRHWSLIMKHYCGHSFHWDKKWWTRFWGYHWYFYRLLSGRTRLLPPLHTRRSTSRIKRRRSGTCSSLSLEETCSKNQACEASSVMATNIRCQTTWDGRLSTRENSGTWSVSIVWFESESSQWFSLSYRNPAFAGLLILMGTGSWHCDLFVDLWSTVGYGTYMYRYDTSLCRLIHMMKFKWILITVSNSFLSFFQHFSSTESGWQKERYATS